MFACAPQCFLVWLTWRVVSLPLPARVYERGDELFYTLYQSMVVFFFENASGVEVIARLGETEFGRKFIARNCLWISLFSTEIDYQRKERMSFI